MLSIDAVEAPVLAGLDLPAKARVLVVGAYKGDTVAFIQEHHPDYGIIVAYEPQEWAWEHLKERFKEWEYRGYLTPADGKGRVTVCGVGLCTREDANRIDGKADLYEFETDACSLLPIAGSRKKGRGHVTDAVFLKDEPQYHLCVMNIEGYEYKLIPYLLEYGIQPQNWLIQFHHKDRMWSEHDNVRYALHKAGYVVEIVGKGWELHTCV